MAWERIYIGTKKRASLRPMTFGQMLGAREGLATTLRPTAAMAHHATLRLATLPIISYRYVLDIFTLFDMQITRRSITFTLCKWLRDQEPGRRRSASFAPSGGIVVFLT